MLNALMLCAATPMHPLLFTHTPHLFDHFLWVQCQQLLPNARVDVAVVLHLSRTQPCVEGPAIWQRPTPQISILNHPVKGGRMQAKEYANKSMLSFLVLLAGGRAAT
jgi:hypothetical protein